MDISQTDERNSKNETFGKLQTRQKSKEKQQQHNFDRKVSMKKVV